MPNPQLNPEQLEKANQLLDIIRKQLLELSAGSSELLFAYRRKISKELTYDERGNPTHRRLLKAKKFGLQQGKCATCPKELPEKYAVLDRLNAIGGYTTENTRLICPECDTRIQSERGYA